MGGEGSLVGCFIISYQTHARPCLLHTCSGFCNIRDFHPLGSHVAMACYVDLHSNSDISAAYARMQAAIVGDSLPPQAVIDMVCGSRRHDLHCTCGCFVLCCAGDSCVFFCFCLKQMTLGV